MSRVPQMARTLREAYRASGIAWTTTLVLDGVGIPAVRRWAPLTVPFEVLDEQVAIVLRAWGMSDGHVTVTTEHLTYADKHGIDSHGCAMLRHYHRRLQAGMLTMTPHIEVVRETETTALVDGGGGLGHVPADMAVTLAVTKAERAGVAAVVVRNSGHYGAAGAYAGSGARRGYVVMATTNTGLPALVPTGGVEAVLGTNPIAFAAPGRRSRPFLLDMATSTAPVGRLMTSWRSGRRIPRGWALGRNGRPVTNPRAAVRWRRLTPLGGSPEMGSHKGYGLAAAVEVLSSVLAGADPVGHFFLAVDPKKFRSDGRFEDDMDILLDSLRATRAIDDRHPVQVAGDPEYAVFDRRRTAGIPLARGVVEDIRFLCQDARVPFLLANR